MSSIAFEEYELMNDSKYRIYVTSIDKALKSFEYTSDWADLISFLGKLNKILSNHTKYPVIPRRMKISKRLAQCLHPHLPSGVHLKALETYDIMFKTMETNRLSQELFIYGSGLFPLLGHAYTNVKQCLLTIYETHFVPLGERLVPGLNGFLSGVLPGLEEGTDYYDRTNSLLEKVCMGVNPSVFYTCLWECLTSNAAVRLPAIMFILNHFDRHLTMKDQIFLMGNDVELMVNGLCTCFQDSSVLIQRSALDFLLAGFPMNNNNLSEEHCQQLITSVLITLLRRDMSLNRRLFAWLLGSDINTSSTSPNKELMENAKQDSKKLETADQYFKTYSKDLLICAIKRVLKKATCENPHDLRPYRILISLLDKNDIGPVILDDILFEVFRLLYLSWKNPGIKAANGSELLKSANLLFSSLEPRYLWQYVGMLFSDACSKMPISTTLDNEDSTVKPVGSGNPTLQEVCSIIIFLLDSLSLEIYSETFSEYLPELFLHIITSLNDHCDTINATQVAASLKLCLKILSKVRSPVLISQSISACDYDNENYSFAVEGKMAEPGKVIQLQTGDTDKVDRKRHSKTFSSDAEGKKNETPEHSVEQSKDELTTIERCLEYYEKFYVTFIYDVRLKLGETRSISSLFKLLLVKSPDAAAEDKAKYLELLLREILSKNSRQSYLLNSFHSVSFRELDCGFSNLSYSKQSIGIEWKDAVAYASKLLIELSTFQTSVPSGRKFSGIFKLKSVVITHYERLHYKQDLQYEKEDALPEWLKSLIICSCWLGNIAVPLQLVAISTLLDLALLCRRNEVYTQRTTPSNTNNSNQVVVFVPLLTLKQLTFIEYQTNIFQVMIHWLWLHLGDPAYEIKCAELICQLQNTLRIPDIIENCIGDSLSHVYPESQRLEAFKKFVKLWHISREVIKCTNTPRTEDTFYKCMLKVLDILSLKESSCLKLEAESWLFHSLMRGDCARLVEPLLLILIDRTTARISISHAKIQQHLPNDNQMLDASDNSTIFAICSVFGNPVTYHLIQHHSDFGQVHDAVNVVTETSPKTENMEENSLMVKSGKNVSAESLPCREYVKKLPFLQNISVFIDRVSSIDEATDISQTTGSEFDSLEEREKSICVSDDGKSGLLRFNTLPLIKDKLGSVDTINCITGEMKKSRSFVSDNGLSKDNADEDAKNVEFVRSQSFSGRDNANSEFKNNLTANNEKADGIFVAKAVIEDILAEVIDNVVGPKKQEKLPEAEKEEENDSAISCNSGCSSVTLEYEKEELYAEDERSGKLNFTDIGTKQLEKTSPNLGMVQFYSHMLLYCDLYDVNRILYTLNKFRDVLSVNAKAFLFATSTTAVPSQSPLVQLLMKHRNSIFARGFQCEERSVEVFSKNTTYLEVLITVCLYYVRSYYPNSGNPKLTKKEIFGNKQVQIACIELLSQIFFHLCGVVQSNKSEMASFIRELLNRCKVQKIALHCVWCCLYDDNQNLHVFITEILHFNRKKDGKSLDNVNEYNQAFQVEFLRLLLSLIVLENDIYQEENVVSMIDNDEDVSIKCDYICDRQIIQQPLFMHLLKKMLEPSSCSRRNHERVISFIIASLPYFKKSLAKIVVKVIRQICWNVEVSSDVYVKSVDYRTKQSIPFNYMVILLDALTILSHYCLLDHVTHLLLKPVTDTTSLRTFNGLFQMYSDFPNIGNFCSGYRNSCQDAKESVLHNLPKIFSSLSTLWQTITSSKQREYENVAGSLLVVKSQILNLLNPIAVHHSMHFFVSVAMVWKEKRPYVDSSSQKMTVIPEAAKDQSVLVHLLSCLSSVSPDILMNTVHRIIKQQFTFNQENITEIEISSLEVLVHYIQLITIPRLMECWNCLLPLLKEAPNVSTRSQFLLCAAVSHFVNRMPSTPDRLMDKKDFKDLQDIIIKLVELCTQIAGACLEQTTWLRRNLAVRENDSLSTSGVLSTGILFSKDYSEKQNAATAQYSVAAQLVLAELLIPLLDTVYSNQDKEKLVTLLINVMYNITPYLKNHTQKNANSFFACSQLLASISGYHYTRKAWKKDVMDLLLDASLFQMEIRSLRHWRTIVDNLMSQQDISPFRDLLSRVPINQNNTLNLFSSKDQEYEQRSQVLKRLAFVILCSDQDQFHKHMPDIQEKITDSLRLPQSTPGIQAQVFLCFRVLLLRMSSHHITSLWPAIITEMVQVMLQMEHELSTDTEEFGSHIKMLSSLDWPWIVNSSNGLHASGHPHCLQLQLAAAKLLKLAVQLPADKLPQFQMYRWAFVGSVAQSDVTKNLSFIPPSTCAADFVPHVVRIASLMHNKFGEPSPLTSPKLLPSTKEVRTLQDLQPFFTALSKGEVGHISPTELEKEIEYDFLEQLPYSSSSQPK